jgi:hypothetical protein
MMPAHMTLTHLMPASTTLVPMIPVHMMLGHMVPSHMTPVHRMPVHMTLGHRLPGHMTLLHMMPAQQPLAHMVPAHRTMTHTALAPHRILQGLSCIYLLLACMSPGSLGTERAPREGLDLQDTAPRWMSPPTKVRIAAHRWNHPMRMAAVAGGTGDAAGLVPLVGPVGRRPGSIGGASQGPGRGSPPPSRCTGCLGTRNLPSGTLFASFPAQPGKHTMPNSQLIWSARLTSSWVVLPGV